MMLKHADVNAVVCNVVDLWHQITVYELLHSKFYLQISFVVFEFTVGGIITSPYVELYFVSSLRTLLTRTKFYSQAFQ